MQVIENMNVNFSQNKEDLVNSKTYLNTFKGWKLVLLLFLVLCCCLHNTADK